MDTHGVTPARHSPLGTTDQNPKGKQAMQILDTDHIEMFVGDARQAAHQLCATYGFHVYGQGTGFPRITSDDTRGAIAYQAIIGGAAPITSVPGLALTAEYRFLGVIPATRHLIGVDGGGDAAQRIFLLGTDLADRLF